MERPPNLKFKIQNSGRGFILVYTIILIGVMLVIVGITFSASVFERRAARSEADSLRAFYAADTGIECVRYYQTQINPPVFNPPTDVDIDCEVGTYDTGDAAQPEIVTDMIGDNDGSCESGEACTATYTFFLNSFSAGIGPRCAKITAVANPRIITVDGAPIVVYDLNVIAIGKNAADCAAALGAGVVERIRWENM